MEVGDRLKDKGQRLKDIIRAGKLEGRDAGRPIRQEVEKQCAGFGEWQRA